MVQQPSYWKVLTRRKVLSTEGGETDTKLSRVLGLYDLTALGVGSTLGAGIYVLAGQIAKEQAGPSVILSFAIAALASLLAGVCYAEFGARVPKAGSAYIYSYVCVGEFAAFVIGWNLILEYVIGTAAVCRGISLYLDTLINDTLKTTFQEITPIEAGFLGSYFDLFAFGLVIIFGVALAFGVETSAMANNFCTCLNIFILLFVIVAGSIKANFDNWSIDVNAVNATGEITTDIGTGGFFPFGFAGTLRGAATCFFGFVGFDCIATTGEEVRNPRKNIPRSILLSLLIIFLCYFGVSTVLTLMVPYYRQDANAPLPYAFEEVGWSFAMWIVSIGGLIGLLASLFGALFPLPRVMYSMAEDGLLFRFLGKVSPRYRVPVTGSIFAAILTALIAGLFDLAQLVDLLSIGTLLAYSVVAISITILRYMENATDTNCVNGNQPVTESTMLTTNGLRITFKSILHQIFNCNRSQPPNIVSTRIVGTLITLFCLLSLGIGLIFTEAYDALLNNQIWVLVVLGVLVVLTLLVLLVICLQPREVFRPRIRVFRVPFVPIVPALSIFINIYLMLHLDMMTWIRFGIWMAIGLPMFIACCCLYDLKNPENRNPSRVAFEKALKASATLDADAAAMFDSNGGHLNGYITGNLEAPDSIKAVDKPLATITRNQHSVKSLDEIVNLSDIGDDLIEMRHPNGKIFFVEDTRSNTSVATVERDDDEATNALKAGRSTLSSEATEEEKSVIAMLDDVLQGEDDGGALSPPVSYNDYSRKFSVDSEMLPSVIETTIVATVHSSSDSSEHDLDDVPELNEDQMGTESATVNPIMRLEHRAECTRLAQQLVDEILASDGVQAALLLYANKATESLTLPANNAVSTAIEPASQIVANLLERKASEASILSMQSVENPMHSERFKNKLSKIISQPPVAPIHKPLKEESKQQEVPADTVRPKLKHSKSEADVRKLVLKAIEGTRSNMDETDESNQLKMEPSKDAHGVPKAPKFDPILYKTVSAMRSRPSLDRLITSETEPAQPAKQEKLHTIEVPVEESVPFKTKLEAILRRGPSHRTQKRPEVEIRPPRAKTMIEISYRDSKSIVNGSRESSPATTADPTEALIMNARKTLKPVSNGNLMS